MGFAAHRFSTMEGLNIRMEPTSEKLGHKARGEQIISPPGINLLTSISSQRPPPLFLPLAPVLPGEPWEPIVSFSAAGEECLSTPYCYILLKEGLVGPSMLSPTPSFFPFPLPILSLVKVII